MNNQSTEQPPRPKKDSRPQRYGWAPGKYLNQCNSCPDTFIGDKRATICADCAYALPDPTEKPAEQPPVDLEGLRELHANRNRATDDRILWDTELRNKGFLIVQELTAARQRIAELEQELTVSTSLAGKLAAKVEELDALLSDQKHYTQQFIVQVRKEQRATQAAQATITSQSATIERMRKALERIERWFGEFPPTGKVWNDGSPLSYGAAYGSNGERDYMREVAREALSTPPSDAGKAGWLPNKPCENCGGEGHFSEAGRYVACAHCFGTKIEPPTPSNEGKGGMNAS